MILVSVSIQCLTFASEHINRSKSDCANLCALFFIVEKCFASIVTLLNGADDFDDHPTPIGRCRAMYDFDASGVDELSLRKGELLILIVCLCLLFF